MIGSPNPYYTIRGTRKETRYIIKDSKVDAIRDSLHMPMVAVTISMFYVISLCVLHYALPKYVLHWGVCYIYLRSRGYSSIEPWLYMFLYWCFCAYCNGVCVVMLVYVVQYNLWLYLILVFCSISLLFMVYSTTASLLHMCLY